MYIHTYTSAFEGKAVLMISAFVRGDMTGTCILCLGLLILATCGDAGGT